MAYVSSSLGKVISRIPYWEPHNPPETKGPPPPPPPPPPPLYLTLFLLLPVHVLMFSRVFLGGGADQHDGYLDATIVLYNDSPSDRGIVDRACIVSR